MNTFEGWLPEFLTLRDRAAKILMQRLPSEITELMKESQDLEPLRYEAEESRAWAESYLSEKKTPRRVWARENTRGLCASIESRAFKVAAHIKMLTKGQG